ncbi:DUF4191 domain-containing protein [Microcella alkalica]|uniref:DUF4191 domain-containing protein n=1 Tax=Microcella alkalica TaxID=355930 RepID=A0A839E3P6_9MICO|nr:DUF4191 domain-containing protein [Microcella alkalica]MBA8846991.1 hypothetical protein [Microcella alkalica]
MARPTAPKPAKEPGRMKQLWQVFRMTIRNDRAALWMMLAGLLLPLAAGIVLAITLSGDNIIGIVLYVITGVLGGILGFLIVLGRRAERVAYRQIAGQPGAVGAVLKSSLRRAWQASEMPVAVTKSQDAVYRAVGKPGVVLIGEGPQSRTRRMLEEERRNVARIIPNVPIHLLHVGPDAESIPLERLPKTLNRLKKAISKAEVYAVNNRLVSLSRTSSLPIPKGIDPTKVRAPKPR